MPRSDLNVDRDRDAVRRWQDGRHIHVITVESDHIEQFIRLLLAFGDGCPWKNSASSTFVCGVLHRVTDHIDSCELDPRKDEREQDRRRQGKFNRYRSLAGLSLFLVFHVSTSGLFGEDGDGTRDLRKHVIQ